MEFSFDRSLRTAASAVVESGLSFLLLRVCVWVCVFEAKGGGWVG